MLDLQFDLIGILNANNILLAIEAIGSGMLYCGLLVILLSILGALRMSTFFAKAHVYSVADSLGVILFTCGFIISHSFNLGSIKLLIMTCLLFFTAVISSMLLTSAVYIMEGQNNGIDGGERRNTSLL